ncbi:hypothetical protein niasHS_014680 [Heterodera schachtii]|uniref:ATP-dependent RNA helicase n=1 Tax=Heterodera schachtii TaxID=97005 RepID=A0ABD2IHQ9_HETSC
MAECCSSAVSDNGTAPSSSSWAELGLSAATLNALGTMNFPFPTPIQNAVIPIAVKLKKDIIGAAETGSGKTLAFAIPILEHWLTNEIATNAQHSPAKGSLFALIISPTRELAVQIKEVLIALSVQIVPRAPKIVAIVGGMSEQKQQRLLKAKPEVIVATPGRFWALRQTGDEHLADFSELRFLVVDEIDRMLEQGHFEELRHIVQDIHRDKKEQKIRKSIASDQTADPSDGIALPPLQTLIFSATLTFTHHIPLRRGKKEAQQMATDPKQKVRRIALSMSMRKGATNLSVIDLTPPQKTPQTLTECRMNCADLLQKDSNLLYLLKRHGGRTLVFANSISAIRRMHSLLKKLALPNTALLHGRMKEKERLKSVDKFKASDDAVLLATDVAARGLDFYGVQNIVHYQCPKTTESYIHRSGRTARASSAGLSVLFVDPLDLHQYLKICRNLNKEEDLELLAVDQPKLMESCRSLVQLATEAEALEHSLKKRKSREQWFERIAREADLVWEEGEEKGRKMGRRSDTDEGPTKEELMRRRKRAVEKALKGKLKGNQQNGEQRERRINQSAEGRKVKIGKRKVRLEKGLKKWVKRAKMDSGR